MRASDRDLARRYVSALFQSARAGGDDERVRRELGEAYRLLAPHLKRFRNPAYGAAKQRAFLRATVGHAVSARTLRFLDLLMDKRRFYLLPATVGELGRLMDEHKGLVRAQVRYAGELGVKAAEALRMRLKAFSGKDVALEPRSAPELLGGVVVRMGDWVLDGSLQGKLRRLAARLTEG